MTEGVKCAVMIPTKGEMKTKTVESLIHMLFYNGTVGIGTGVIFAEGTLLTTVRSRLIAEALTKDYSHVFFLDSDMVFPPDMIQKLLDTKKSVVCAVAKVRGGKNFNVFTRDKPTGKYVPHTEVPDQLIEIDATGCACILMERAVLEEIMEAKRLATQEWNGLSEKYEGNNMVVKEVLENLKHDRLLFNAIGEKSEDILMCEYIKSCGYSIWAEGSLKLGHINDIEIR